MWRCSLFVVCVLLYVVRCLLRADFNRLLFVGCEVFLLFVVCALL